MPALQFDAIVVGGGPAGATAAHELACDGYQVLLIDRPGRIKPCGGAIPPRLLADFDIPPSLLAGRVGGAKIIAPSGAEVDMAIDGSYVGMVDRDEFDPWLRQRAASSGAVLAEGRFESLSRLADGRVEIVYTQDGERQTAHARLVIGADGANSQVRRQALGPDKRPPYVFAYHEIIRTPSALEGFDDSSCQVFYQGRVSPDFYGWVFPHGETTSVGVGTAVKGHDLKQATSLLREVSGLADCETIREEGAPLPLKPLGRWDDGRNVVLAGDAAGVVAPASGEGIYYAMLAGRLAAEGGAAFLATGAVRALAQPRKKFMREHGRVFMILGLMQGFWYKTDRRRERFVAICNDPDVQRLTWESYLNKRLVRTDPLAHVRVFFKDLAHMARLAIT
ncbi:MAG: geranylgeranyl diphosphate reductase [Aliihoeflea sp.]